MSSATPTLTTRDAPGTPRAVVLMLHGGTPTSRRAVDGRSASWLRSAAMQRALAPEALAAGTSTWLVRFRVRGWNVEGADAVADARWGLEEVRRRVGEVPVVLLGHSMGARTAVHVADDPLVVGVVALAPWLMPTEPVETLRGRHLCAAHGTRDRITSFAATAAYVERARAFTSSAELRDMGRVGHYMLRDPQRWNRVAWSAASAMLDGAG